jgi:hypothetical protein
MKGENGVSTVNPLSVLVFNNLFHSTRHEPRFVETTVSGRILNRKLRGEKAEAMSSVERLGGGSFTTRNEHQTTTDTAPRRSLSIMLCKSGLYEETELKGREVGCHTAKSDEDNESNT